MSDVKRYEFRKDALADCYCDIEESARGGYVTEEDYESLRTRLAEAEKDAARWRYAYKMPAGEFMRLVGKAQKGHPGGLNALIDATAVGEPSWNPLFKRWEVPDPTNAALRVRAERRENELRSQFEAEKDRHVETGHLLFETQARLAEEQDKFNRCLGDLQDKHARLAECEKERDRAFEVWKKFHNETLAAFIKNEHDPLKAQLAEAENQRDYWEAQAKRTSVENLRAGRKP